ncbi:ABC transporter ATP-binding protein [Jeotgalibacillus salarius]|uniref:ABC transporter ATP-binding protein n=1 Tax=Jeotgalibacillus salarius TaxID=546023 RepID=A0A4Y8LH90_9BACL|nr:ABC transporter ATP-binding protein [Jeotgalibacillus salarius]TFE01547.1 ABC transporter ATP-binding protein [Jeotgalibacillus salarius]
MHAVEVSGISKSFGKTEVLKDISFSVSKGEIVGLIGPSGSGKTTVVKTIIGMEKADEGKVTVQNQRMPNRLLLNQIGYMAQSDALYMELSAEQQLVFFSKLYGVPKNKRKQRISECMGLVDLEKDLSKKVMIYSGGMKRRLSLALALLHEPDILVLDEPTVGIDPRLRKQIWEKLQLLKEQGGSILVTTHVMDEAERCDRLVLLLEGSVLAVGTPQELKNQFNTDSIESIFLLKKAGESA